ncbi:hypothetical protein J3R30DRAFT_3485746 [Lentinula aciculospora]|uniref:Uncharacterized protein n=1 Tax=Lentinula aciculospora TaxID=153920 RepID=A0A9W9DML8_9AGAR|nr:hypothetical protein J3R30DRAFT_3485746 [Lentinula aciculospora]
MEPTPHHRFTFPPFPAAPNDVSIVSFEDFQEGGIQIQDVGHEGLEVDALNIPTVVISKKHAGDYCKTNSQRKEHVQASQRSSQNSTSSNLHQRPIWIQQWEDSGTRKSGEIYNQNENRADRIHQATRSFNTGRIWPQTDKHVREQWDQFQLYIGILNIMPIWRPKQAARELEGGGDVDNDFEDDEDSFLPLETANEPNEMAREVDMSTERGEQSFYPKKRPRPRPPYENYNKAPVLVDGKEEIDQLIQESKARKADRLNEFLNDPKGRIQVYLSSYMRKQGFHYVDRNLTLLPFLIRAYINFLIKEQVFSIESEPETITSLNEGLAILDVADSELPLTSQITKRLPWNDIFCGGCEELFDVKSKERELSAEAWTQKNQTLSSDVESEDNGVSSTAAATIASTSVPEQAASLELDIDTIMPTLEQDSDILETPIQNVNAASASSPRNSDEGTTLGALKTPGENELGAWGSWHAEPDKANTSAGWGEIDLDDVIDDSWGGGDVNIWAVPPPPTLFPILGPTALPLTHTSGIVEWSMRRIRSVVHPENEDALTSTSKFSGDGPSAEAVEVDLSSRLSQVVMEPWLNWENPSEEGDTASPQIKGTSRGRVVVYQKDQGVMYEYDSDVRSNAFAAALAPNDASDRDLLPAHDPLNHSITLTVEPETAKLLRVGMGLGANWVQIARQTDLRSKQEVTEMETKGVEGKAANLTVDLNASGASGVCDIRGRFWYLSDLLIVLPSYHII